MIELTGPDNQKIELNPYEVVTVRPVRPDASSHFGKSIRCLVHTTDGKFVAVTEDCDTVKKKVEEVLQ